MVHSQSYLERSLRSSKYLAAALEIPQLARAPWWMIDWRVLRPMRLATAGTILAAREAMECGLAINMSGGYHHASADRGHGFSVYADAAIAVQVLRREGRLAAEDRVLYIDLDAHQGNGFARVFAQDRNVFIFDVYNRSIFPHDLEAKRRIDRDLPIDSGYDNSRYLQTLERYLPEFLESISRNGRPKLAIYNAGTDILSGDPVGMLNVSAAGVLKRDQYVIRLLRDHQLPVVMLPSGGYTGKSYELIATSAGWAVEQYGGCEE